MGLIIIFVLIGIVAGVIFTKKTKGFFKGDPFWPPMAAGLIGALVSVILIPLYTQVLPVKWVNHEPVKLVSLRDKSSVEGSFMLGSGQIGLVDYFVYYREWGTGFKKGKVRAEKSVIFEDSEVGTLLVKKMVYKEKWMNYIFFSSNTMDGPFYEFHVPKGTIIQKFSLE